MRDYILEMTLTDYICQEKKEEENSPVLKTVLTHQYNDLKSTYKSMEEDRSQPSETIQTWEPTERK